MKNVFSIQPEQYAAYRPAYPAELLDYILSSVKERRTVWDCGTGTGQIAIQLAPYFERVFASDISEAQLSKAKADEKVEYSMQAAENTDYPDDIFDLIVVAQAIHWFDFDLFYDEVNRVLRDNGVFAVIGYDRPVVSPEIDMIISDFYTRIVGPFWDPERKYIDEQYKTIPFPFTESLVPEFKNSLQWDLEHFIGYLKTWSAVKHYEKANGVNPVDVLLPQLRAYWNDAEEKKIDFPILLRVGRKQE